MFSHRIGLSKLSVMVMAASLLGGSAAWAEIGRGASLAAPAFSSCPDSETPAAQVDTPCLAIVDFEDGVSAVSRPGIIRGAGAVMRFSFGVVNAAAVMVPNEGAYWSLASDPAVARLIPDRPVEALKPPSGCDPWPACKDDTTDPEPTGQIIPAGVWRIGADTVWGSYPGAGVTVAIVDTGLDSGHADLAGAITGSVSCLGDGTLTGTNCVTGGEDDNGHGTHVGGTVAALENNIDVVGVAPGASLYAIKVLDSNGSGWDSNVIAGLQHALLQGVDVVNMSLGRGGNCSNSAADPSAAMVRAAIQSLSTAGVAVVVSAGNSRSSEVKDMVPAGCPEVIAVASTTAEDGNNKCKRLPDNILADTASYFTTDGAYSAITGVGVTISAPGETREDNNCAMFQSQGIESTALGGGTTTMSGTSMASPHVAGVIALMRQANPGLLPEQARDILRDTADRIGTAPIDNPYIGESFDGEREGVVNAADAVWMAAAGF